MRTKQFSTSAIAADDALLREAVTAILAAIGSEPGILRQLRTLVDTRSDAAERQMDFAAVTDRFLSHLRPFIQDALTCAVDGDRLVDDIRKFYLQPKESYTLQELASIWRIALDDVRAMFHDALASSEDGAEPGRFRVAWSDALGASTVFQVYRPVEVERALGAEFHRLRSDIWTTVPVLIHLPRFVVTTLCSCATVVTTGSLASRVERFISEMCEAVHLLRGFSAEEEA